MIISASRRTDIPNYYSEWFYNRINAGFVLVRNPMNVHQVSRINLSPEVVDCIVFWTKNPKAMLKRLDELSMYNYYFQFTLNSYGTDVEPNVPLKHNDVILTFKKLSEKIGEDKVIWRYDPILLSEKYTINYHIKYFEEIAKRLSKHTKKCTISFIDLYRNTKNNVRDLELKETTEKDIQIIAKNLSQIAETYGMTLNTCAENIDLSQYNISHASCVDQNLIQQIIGYRLDVSKDKNQRQECGCVESIDIGLYNTCKNGCKYCYANYSEKITKNNVLSHNKQGALLCGELSPKDIVKVRKVKSQKNGQLSFID